MKNKSFSGMIALLLAAFFWGVAFVFQLEGMDYVPPITFMAMRTILASVFLAVLLVILRGPSKAFKFNKTTLRGGIGCGVLLSLASGLQQVGIQYTTAGKSGFITALYMVFVPIFAAVIFRRKIEGRVWLSVLVAAFGMYLLCIKSGFSVGWGDTLTFGCAIAFAWHILWADNNSDGADAVQMSFLQMVTCFVIALVITLIFEKPTFAAIWDARVSIAYCGFVSSGIAYTLQLVGQQTTRPEAASIIMCLESVFAGLAGWVLLSEVLSARELIGCVLMFAAIILVQVNPKKKEE